MARRRTVAVELVLAGRLSEDDGATVDHEHHWLTDETEDDEPPRSGIRLVRTQVGCAGPGHQPGKIMLTLVDLIDTTE